MGLIISPHCIVMCGPLAFTVLRTSERPAKIHLLYHAARTASYVLFGVLAGLLGLTLVDFFQIPTLKIFPWILVAFLVVYGLGLERYIPKLPFAKRSFAKVSPKIAKLPKAYGALLLGAFTPFLPCGPLYMIFWIALLSGSPLFGGEISLGFAIGTIPLMFLVGTQFHRLQKILTPRLVYRVQRTVALIAAGVLAWRMTYGSDCPFGDPTCGF